MATVILLRHGRTTANATGVLAGRTPGVGLDGVGRAQAAAAAERLASVRLTRVVTSPLLRCRQTAAIAAGPHALAVTPDRGLVECDYGDWQGRPLAELATEGLWRLVQAHPSRVVFPGGEAMAAMQHRAVTAIREVDAAVTASDGNEAVWLAVSHGDLIKAILADAHGMHLDLFQRIEVHPASLSVIAYGAHGPRVLAINSTGGDLTGIGKAPSDAVVGGGSVAPPS